MEGVRVELQVLPSAPQLLPTPNPGDSYSHRRGSGVVVVPTGAGSGGGEGTRVHGARGLPEGPSERQTATMELWRQCTHWLIQCRVLPPSHRVTWDGAQVCELAQALRDGVLLCQLLNNLLPQAINLREVNLRPQMSQVSRRGDTRAQLDGGR